jgi:cephalosporin hydroxylase
MFDWMTQFDRFSLSPDNVSAAEKTQSELHKLFYSNADTLVFKWRHYLKIYEDHLSRFRNTPFHMLEIGVAQGGSLSLWRRYFGPEALLFGIDIDDRCRQFDKRDAHVRIGSQDDPAFLRSVVSEMGGVDVVLDDGSHMASHQLTSFQVLFPLLNEGGVYICEDLHAAHSPAFDGGYRRSGTFIEVAKQIVDDIHADFHDQPQSVPGAHRSIHGICFYNSMVVIEKRLQQEPRHVQVGP